MLTQRASLSRFGGIATIVPARTTLLRFAANRVEPDLVGVAFSTIHHTAQKAAQQRPEAAFFGRASKGERFGLGWKPTGCETQHDLVSRARETEIYGASAERYSPSSHFGATHPRRYPHGVIPWIAACRLVWTRRMGPCYAACGRGSGLNRGTGISSSEPCQRSVTRGSVPFG
jgi:hypothetical protein